VIHLANHNGGWRNAKYLYLETLVKKQSPLFPTASSAFKNYAGYSRGS